MTKKSRESQDIPKKPTRLIFCCSGASNVGALSYLASMRLSQEEFGNFSCIAGIAGNITPMVEGAKKAQERILIDGCPTGCGRRIMEIARVPVDRYIVVTELGIKKTHDYDVDDLDIETIVRKARHPG
ncbi:MAG: putative zinc-binding protein [Methanoregulaceae archaeon]|nr:putative zinc-binding protein [Methanoregulaceae archaeon]